MREVLEKDLYPRNLPCAAQLLTKMEATTTAAQYAAGDEALAPRLTLIVIAILVGQQNRTCGERAATAASPLVGNGTDASQRPGAEALVLHHDRPAVENVLGHGRHASSTRNAHAHTYTHTQARISVLSISQPPPSPAHGSQALSAPPPASALSTSHAIPGLLGPSISSSKREGSRRVSEGLA